MIISLRLDGPDPEELPDETLVNRMRSVRNRLLTQSDWTQVADAPVDVDAWAIYRQELRDFPTTWTPVQSADLPDPPA